MSISEIYLIGVGINIFAIGVLMGSDMQKFKDSSIGLLDIVFISLFSWIMSLIFIGSAIGSIISNKETK